MDKKIKEKFTKEKVRFKTEKILDRVNHYAREAHARHVIIKDRHHQPFFRFPMTMGIFLAALLPIIASIGLAAFLMNDWQVDIHKRED